MHRYVKALYVSNGKSYDIQYVQLKMPEDANDGKSKDPPKREEENLENSNFLMMTIFQKLWYPQEE
ncbi:hypothetical protein Avbf_12548 [Armadillidium vulgare]|nr:hypothetical protein Avbf_12548 [Armadillidium vulgare]